MSGLTKGQAIRRLDTRAVELKDDLMRYWELAGLTEPERDRAVNAVARLFGALRAAAFRRAYAEIVRGDKS